MKKCVIVIIILLMAEISILTSCENSLESPATELPPTHKTAESSAIFEEALIKENRSEIFTYNEAYDLFKKVYSWGTHADYIEYVDNEANKMKNEVVRVYNEIIDILKGKYQSITDGPGPYRSYSDYYKSFILPFETYYNSRMEAAEQVQEAYLGISDILTYGGNAGGDCSVLWKYVHYRNLYNELCDLKNFIE